MRLSSSWDLEKAGSTGGDIRELQVVGWGKVSIEDDVVVVGDDTNNGSHGDTSVLALDGTTAFEGLGLSIEPSKRIKDTKRGGGADLELIDIQSGGSLSLLGRGESVGGTSEEVGENERHHVVC